MAAALLCLLAVTESSMSLDLKSLTISQSLLKLDLLIVLSPLSAHKVVVCVLTYLLIFISDLVEDSQKYRSGE